MLTHQAECSRVSIIVILAQREQLSTTEAQKVSTFKCDIDGQQEIAVWLPKPEVLTSSKV